MSDLHTRRSAVSAGLSAVAGLLSAKSLSAEELTAAELTELLVGKVAGGTKIVSVCAFDGRLDDAIDSLQGGKQGGIVLVDDYCTLPASPASAPYHVPPNVVLWVPPLSQAMTASQGPIGTRVPGGTTYVVFDGSLVAGAYQIFRGSISVKRGANGRTTEVRPEWWGAGADDATTGDWQAIYFALRFFSLPIPGIPNSAGIVRFRAATYDLDGFLSLPSNVLLKGEGPGATVLRDLAPTPRWIGRGFLEAWGTASTYSGVRIEDLSIRGDADWDYPTQSLLPGNSPHGLVLNRCTAHLKNVEIRGFAESALTIRGGINSKFENVHCATTKVGAQLSRSGTTDTTTQVFDGCRFAQTTEAGVRVTGSRSVLFTGQTIIEDNQGNGAEVDDCPGPVIFDTGHFENNALHHLRAGVAGRVAVLEVRSPEIVQRDRWSFCPNGRGFSQRTHDVFNLDEVRWARLDAPWMSSGFRAAVLRTTARTGRVIWTGPVQDSTSPAGSIAYYPPRYVALPATEAECQDPSAWPTPENAHRGPRAPSTDYEVNDVISVDMNGPVFDFICVQAGTSDMNPDPVAVGYDPASVGGWNLVGVQDGGCLFTRTDALCLHNFAQVIRFGYELQTDSAIASNQMIVTRDDGEVAWRVEHTDASGRDQLRLRITPQGSAPASGAEILIDGSVKLTPTADRDFLAFVPMSGGTHHQASPIPAKTLAGYLEIEVDGSTKWLPYYN